MITIELSKEDILKEIESTYLGDTDFLTDIVYRGTTQYKEMILVATKILKKVKEAGIDYEINI